MRNNVLTLSLIREILLHELCIKPERIVIYNQKFIIPKSPGMMIYIEPKSAPIAISTRYLMDSSNNEHQDSNWLEEISVEIYSRDIEALQRKEEVAMALYSIFSQQVQEKNSFKIFRNKRIIPINEIEGAARLYRFDIECRVQSWYTKTKVAEFFDSFNVNILDEGGDPPIEIEFTIPATDPTKYPKT